MGFINSKRIFVLLCISGVCTSNILIDPAILLEASHQFSTLLLGANVNNVKDIADSLLSHENIGAISTIASDAYNLIKSTIEIAQSNVDIQSVTDNILNSIPASKIGSAFEGFLNTNPDLKLSTSDYASSVTSSIIRNINGASDSFLTSNPDLTKSTSQYTTDLINDIYTNTITPKLNDVLATLDTSPLAENTRNTIDKAPKTVENIVQFYNTKVAQISDIKSKITDSSIATGLTDFTANSKSVVGAKINENFDKILNDYPQLKQSTSEFTVTTLKNDIIPKLEETRDFLYESPLGKSTREFSARSTSDVLTSFSTDVATRFSPYTNVIGDVSTRIVVRATSPFTDVISGLNDAIQTSTSIDTQKASTDFLSAQLSSIPSVNSIDLTSINQGTNNILSSSSAIIETIVPNIQNAFVAIGNANIRLASELGDAGNILGGNILNLGMATGDVANKIIVSAAATGGAVVSSISESAVVAPDVISTLATKTFTMTPTVLADLGSAVSESTADIAGRTVSSVSSAVESQLTAVNGWKFFTDENHWENGFWEQKITQLRNLKQSDFSSESLQKINDETLKILAKAGERFTAQYENSRMQSYDLLGLKDSNQDKSFVDYSQNFENFQNNLQSAKDKLFTTSEFLLKKGETAVNQLNEMKNSGVLLFTEEVASNDFI